jgi:High potential iron-sulfur protein
MELIVRFDCGSIVPWEAPGANGPLRQPGRLGDRCVVIRWGIIGTIARCPGREVNIRLSQKIPSDGDNATLPKFRRTLTMHHKISRRSMVKSGLIASTLFPAIGFISGTADAAALTPLDPNDPVAKGVSFVNDASKVKASENPTYKAGQKCSNCAQYQGKASDATAGCNIFPGHSVPAAGWCKAWAQKPGS